MGKSKGKLGGIGAAAELLSGLDEVSRQRLLRNLQQRDPELTRKIREELFTFTDLGELASKDMQALLREVPLPKLALALRGTVDSLREAFSKSLSQKAAELLREEMEAQGPQKLADVRRAQTEMIETAKRLESQGRLRLPTRQK